MQVSGVGGIGIGIGGGGIGMGAANAVSPAGGASAGPASAPVSSSVTGSLSVTNAGLQGLAETLQNFSTAEILIALMLASALNQKDDQNRGSSGAALGLLLGLGMAGQVGQTVSVSWQFSEAASPSGIGSAEGAGALGGQLDFSA